MTAVPGDVDASQEPLSAGLDPAPRNIARRTAAFGSQRLAVIGVWILMAAGFGIAEPKLFIRHGTFSTIFGSQQPLVFLSLALVITFAVNEFDLSVPSMLGLAATLVPVMNVQHHVPLLLSCLIAFGCTALVGLANGLIVVILGVDPIVTTLGMSSLLVGLTLWLSHLTTIGGLSASFSKITVTPVLGLPISFYYGIGLALAMAYVLALTPLGRHIAFVGANRDVARLAGVRVTLIRMGAYLTSSVICALGGIILVAGLGGYDPTSSANYLLPAFAAAFLSTAVIVPGRFNPIGAIVAIYFLETGIVGLQLAGYAGWISDVFFGAALVIAVAVSTVVRRRAVRG